MVGYAGAAAQPAQYDQSNAIFDLISQIARNQPGGIRALTAGEAPGAVPDGPAGMAPARVPSVNQLAVPQQFNPGFQSPTSPPMQQQPMPDDPAMSAGGPGAPDLAAMLGAAAGGGGGGAPPGGAPAPDAGGGFMDGMGGSIVDALSALGGINTDNGPLVAFGSGFAGAQGNRQRREDRKLALTERAEDKAYRRSRDSLADSRYADETGYQHGRDKVGDERYAKSEARSAALDELQQGALALGIKKSKLEYSKLLRDYENGGISIDTALDIESKVNGHMSSFAGSAGSSDNPAAYQAEEKRYREQLKQTLGADGGTGGAVPKNGAPAGDGDGSSIDTPASISSGSDVQGLPAGSYFVAPPGTVINGKDVSGQTLMKH